MLTSEMDGMTALEKFRFKVRNCNTICLEFIQGCLEIPKILLIGQNNQIAVSTKLRCAVQHASLTADKQVAYHVA
ncbi:MAG: hypothetical protein MUF23_12625 [Pirellula sp.]|nr:hypothetical protein [Pirellula sp.]